MRFIHPVKAKRVPKSKPVRKVSEDTLKILKHRLLAERKHIICKSTGLKALGGVVICPIACVEKICKRATYIKELNDILNISGLRVQFARKFFDIVTDILNI